MALERLRAATGVLPPLEIDLKAKIDRFSARLEGPLNDKTINVVLAPVGNLLWRMAKDWQVSEVKEKDRLQRALAILQARKQKAL